MKFKELVATFRKHLSEEEKNIYFSSQGQFQQNLFNVAHTAFLVQLQRNGINNTSEGNTKQDFHLLNILYALYQTKRIKFLSITREEKLSNLKEYGNLFVKHKAKCKGLPGVNDASLYMAFFSSYNSITTFVEKSKEEQYAKYNVQEFMDPNKIIKATGLTKLITQNITSTDKKTEKYRLVTKAEVQYKDYTRKHKFVRYFMRIFNWHNINQTLEANQTVAIANATRKVNQNITTLNTIANSLRKKYKQNTELSQRHEENTIDRIRGEQVSKITQSVKQLKEKMNKAIKGTPSKYSRKFRETLEQSVLVIESREKSVIKKIKGKLSVLKSFINNKSDEATEEETLPLNHFRSPIHRRSVAVDTLPTSPLSVDSVDFTSDDALSNMYS